MSTLDKFVTQKKEDLPPPAPSKKMGTLEEWLENNFRVEETKRNYRKTLLVFVKAIYGKDKYDSIQKVNDGVEQYLNEPRTFLEDFKKFVRYMNSEKYAASSIHNTCTAVKKFFDRQGLEIAKRDWDDMKTSLLPINVTATQDDILTKEQLRSVLNHMSISGKAVALFLLSTGARIGETMKLRIEDLDLDADPPQVNIRPQYTKKGVGGRVIWMSYEARDALKEWLKVKDLRRKRGTNKPFPKDMVFGFEAQNFRVMWKRALRRTGLDKKDSTTGYLIYHIHTLRKFFSTQMSEATVQESVIHAWMGHKGYLDSAYKRYTKEKLAQMYRDHMDAISIYGSGVSSEFTKKLEEIESQVKEKDAELQMVHETLDKLGIPNDRPLEQRLLEYFKVMQTKQTSQPSIIEAATPTQTVQKPKPTSVEEVQQEGYFTCQRDFKAYKFLELPCILDVNLQCEKTLCHEQVMNLIK